MWDVRPDGLLRDESSGADRLTVSAREARRSHAVELLVFLFLVVPSLIIPLFARQALNVSFTLAAVSTMFADVALVALVLFFLWRNREPVTLIGWSSRDPRHEALLGLALFFPVSYGAGALENALRSAGFSAPLQPPPALTPSGGLGQTLLATCLVLVVAVAEETIFRGYVLTRLREITHSGTIAALVSSAIFAVGHGYEGTAGVVAVGTLGLAFALVFLWRKSLVAPITMHFCQDFLGIVLAPMVARLTHAPHGR